MCRVVCEQHQQCVCECRALHHQFRARHNPITSPQRPKNRLFATISAQIKGSWSWRYKLAFLVYSKQGEPLSTYSIAHPQPSPPRDLHTPNTISNFPYSSSSNSTS